MKVNQYWSKIGIHRIIDGNGHYENDDATSYSEGELKNGFQEGLWTGFDVRDKTSFTEKYKRGLLVSGVSIDSLKNEFPYAALDELATPNQTNSQVKRYLKHNIRVPAKIIQNKLSGRIKISFVISKEGWITKVKILEGMGYGLDEELVRVLQNFEKWNPARRRGVPFDSEKTVSFSVYKGSF